MRENCTSGPVRGGGSNAPTYSAVLPSERCQEGSKGATVAEAGMVAEERQPAGGLGLSELVENEPPEQF